MKQKPPPMPNVHQASDIADRFLEGLKSLPRPMEINGCSFGEDPAFDQAPLLLVPNLRDCGGDDAGESEVSEYQDELSNEEEDLPEVLLGLPERNPDAPELGVPVAAGSSTDRAALPGIAPRSKPIKFATPSGHELRYDAKQKTFGIHCCTGIHNTGTKCKYDRTANKGPVGAMLAWVEEHCCANFTDRAGHQGTKTNADLLNLAVRVKWRAWAVVNIPEAIRLEALERNGVTDEPVRLP
jgi:hypothetical protein